MRLKGDGDPQDLPSTLVRARSALLGRIQEVLSATRSPALPHDPDRRAPRGRRRNGCPDGRGGRRPCGRSCAGATSSTVYAPDRLRPDPRLVHGRRRGERHDPGVAARARPARWSLGERLRLGAASAPEHAGEPASLLRQAERGARRAPPRTACGSRRPTRSAVPAAPACGTDPFDVVDALNGRRLIHVGRPVVDALTRAARLPRGAAPACARPDGTSGPAEDLAAVMDRPGLSLLLDARMLERVADDLAASPRARVIAADCRRRPSGTAEWLDMLAAHLGARPGIASRLIVGLPRARP